MEAEEEEEEGEETDEGERRTRRRAQGRWQSRLAPNDKTMGGLLPYPTGLCKPI